VILGAAASDSDPSDAKPAPAPAKLVQPPTKAPAPATLPKDVARKATPATTNLAKILAGQVAPPATPKPSTSSGRK